MFSLRIVPVQIFALLLTVAVMGCQDQGKSTTIVADQDGKLTLYVGEHSEKVSLDIMEKDGKVTLTVATKAGTFVTIPYSFDKSEEGKRIREEAVSQLKMSLAAN